MEVGLVCTYIQQLTYVLHYDFIQFSLSSAFDNFNTIHSDNA